MARAARCCRRGPVLGAANVLDVDAIEQHAQLRGIERDARGTLMDARETEPITLESFVINDEAQQRLNVGSFRGWLYRGGDLLARAEVRDAAEAR